MIIISQRLFAKDIKKNLPFNPSLCHKFNGAMRLRVGRKFRTLPLGGIKVVFRDKQKRCFHTVSTKKLKSM